VLNDVTVSPFSTSVARQQLARCGNADSVQVVKQKEGQAGNGACPC
jgi:hypothetical protein